jgi:hypothetical protein
MALTFTPPTLAMPTTLKLLPKSSFTSLRDPNLAIAKGNVLIIVVKALYGLRTSGARFHKKFADTLKDMGFYPSFADPDVWMKHCITHYEYVCVYVNDLAVMMKCPADFFRGLKERKYELKGVGEITYHLGGDFYRDPDGTLVWGARTYVKRILNQSEAIFGNPPKKYTSPINKADHPELDTTAFCSPDDTQHYQSLIGAFQWAIALGRWDIFCATMTMGRFHVAPHIGHLQRLQRICGFLRKYPEGAIRFRTNIPDYSHLDHVTYDWTHSSMATPTRNYHITCQFRWERKFAQLLLKMQTCCMILPPVVL